MSAALPTSAGHRLAAVVRTLLLSAMPVIGILWLMDVPFRVGLPVVGAAYLSLMIGLATAAGFLLHPFRRQPGWAEPAVGAAAIAAWTWGGINHEDWLVSFGPRTVDQWAPGVMALVLMLDSMRRACGMAVTSVVVVLGAYAFLGHHLPGNLEAPYTPPARVVMYFYADTNGVPGMILGVATTVVLGFVLMGAVMGVIGASGFFTDLAMAGMAARRGGPAKVAVVASSLFGTVSGSTVANVMTTGVVTIPLMKRTGFKSHVAGAIEAVASNGGQLAPPVMGATAFLIADFLQVPYAQVVLSALIPAAIHYLILFMQADLIARAEGLRGLPRAELPRAGRVLRRNWPFLVPIGLLIWLLFGMGYEAGKSALCTAAAMAVAGILVNGRSPGVAKFPSLLPEAGKPLTVLILICGAAGIVVGSLNLTGVGFLLTNTLADIGESFGQLAMLAVTAVIAIILGMGMPTAAVCIVLSIILAPALVRMGIEPMAAHLFIFDFGLLSMLTPPVGVASYTAGALAGAGLWQTGLSGMRLGAGAFILPFLFAENPALVGHGSVWAVILAILSVVAASYLLARALAPGPGPTGRLAQLAGAIVTGSATVVLGPESPLSLIPVAGVAILAFGGRLLPALNRGETR